MSYLEGQSAFGPYAIAGQVRQPWLWRPPSSHRSQPCKGIGPQSYPRVLGPGEELAVISRAPIWPKGAAVVALAPWPPRGPKAKSMRWDGEDAARGTAAPSHDGLPTCRRSRLCRPAKNLAKLGHLSGMYTAGRRGGSVGIEGGRAGPAAPRLPEASKATTCLRRRHATPCECEGKEGGGGHPAQRRCLFGHERGPTGPPCGG